MPDQKHLSIHGVVVVWYTPVVRIVSRPIYAVAVTCLMYERAHVVFLEQATFCYSQYTGKLTFTQYVLNRN